MHCIFCREPSSIAPIEHVVPHALGNTEHFAPPGSVCGSCNAYFAIKIEKPVLDSPFMRFLRADRNIANRRGRIPAFEANEALHLPDYRQFSRFLGKMALEALALRLSSVDGWNDEIVRKEELNPLRDYVRRNDGETWPFFHRNLYPVNNVFTECEVDFEVLHEFNFLYIGERFLYFIIAIFGAEFAISMSGPSMDSFITWLDENDGISPLYRK